MKTKFIILISVFIILTPILIVLGAQFKNIEITNTFWGLLEYSGTIIGGALTLFGVWWTLYDSRKDRRIDIAMQDKPILIHNYTDAKEIKQFQAGEVRIDINDQRFNKGEYQYISEVIAFENIGASEMQEIEFEELEIEVTNTSNFSNDGFDIFKNSVILGNKYINFIPIKGKVYFLIGILKPNQQSELYKSGDFELLLNVSFRIVYFDSNKTFEYTNILDFNIKATWSDSQYESYIFNSSMIVEQHLI